MTEPTKETVLEAIAECRRIGETRFINRYADGKRPRSHYLEYDTGAGIEHLPLKAIWAAAHRPPVRTATYNTETADAGLKRLGFNSVMLPKRVR